MQDITLPAIVFLCVLAVASLAVLAFCVQRLLRGDPVVSPPVEPSPQPHWMSVLLVLLWVSMQLMALVNAPTSDGKPPEVDDVRVLCGMSALIFLGLGFPLTTQGPAALSGLGFRSEGFPSQLRIGVLGFLASVLPVIVAYSTTLPWRTVENQHGLLQLLSDDPSVTTLLWVILAAVILAPLLEELMYRVILQTWLQQIAPPREALIAVAVLFAAVHRLPDAIPLLPLALVLGYVYQQTRSFIAVVVLHMLFNATNLTLALL